MNLPVMVLITKDPPVMVLITKDHSSWPGGPSNTIISNKIMKIPITEQVPNKNRK
jgi:hypothetical protein